MLTWSSHPAAPWDEILAAWDGAANERRPVLVHYDAIEPPQIDLSRFDEAPLTETQSGGALLRLNIGRDLGVRRGVVVLLWVRGLGPLEVVQAGAPDLWAHRLLVCRFPSATDFPIREGEHFDGPDSANQDAQIAKLEAEIEDPWIFAPRRVEKLDALVVYLDDAGKWSEMQQRLGELRALHDAEGLNQDPLYVAGMLNRELFVASRLRDMDRFEVLLEEATAARSAVSPLTHSVVTGNRAFLYDQQGRDAEALLQYEKGLAVEDAITAAQTRNFAIPGAGTLVSRAKHFLYELELPIRAVVDAQAAERRVAEAVADPPAHRHAMRSDIEATLAEARRRMGLVDEALALGWRAVRRRIALRSWDLVDVLQDIYVEMGLPGIPRMLWLTVLESIPADDASSELRREIHQGLAELGVTLGETVLVRVHGASALTALATTTDMPPSLHCHFMRVRARLARKLRPQWHDPADLDPWAEALQALVQAPQTPPFHRDLLRIELTRWRLAQQDLSAAFSLVSEALGYRAKHLGPRKIVDASILAAEIEHDRGEHASALAHLDAAYDMLCAQPEEAQPFFLWARLQRQRAALAHAEGQTDAGWAAFDVLLEIADRRRLVPDCIDLRLEQAETNLGHLKAQDNADTCLARTLELGYMRLEGRARLLLAELAWRRRDRATAARELDTATWLVGSLGPIDAQRRARTLADELRKDP